MQRNNIKKAKNLKSIKKRRLPNNIFRNRTIISRNHILACKSNPIRSPKVKADMKFSIINSKKKHYKYVRMET